MKLFAAITIILLSCCYGDKAPSKIVAGAVNSLLPPGEVQKKVLIIENMIRNSSNKDGDRELVQTTKDRLNKKAEKDIENARKQKELEVAKKSLEDSKNRISLNHKKVSENGITMTKLSSMSQPPSSSSSVFTKFDKDGKR